jgi:hypothetical protein
MSPSSTNARTRRALSSTMVSNATGTIVLTNWPGLTLVLKTMRRTCDKKRQSDTLTSFLDKRGTGLPLSVRVPLIRPQLLLGLWLSSKRHPTSR